VALLAVSGYKRSLKSAAITFCCAANIDHFCLHHTEETNRRPRLLPAVSLLRIERSRLRKFTHGGKFV
jgi:hypothetical protein